MLETDHAGIERSAPDAVLVPFDAQFLNAAGHLQQLEHSGAAAAARETAIGTSGTVAKPSGLGTRDLQAIQVERPWSDPASRTTDN